MIIREQYENLPEYETLDNGISLIHEHLLEICLGDLPIMRIVCTPSRLTELVLGRLLSEGIICSTEEVDGIYICEYGRRARVILQNMTEQVRQLRQHSGEPEKTETCCSDTHVLAADFLAARELAPVPDAQWREEWIRALGKKLEQDTPLHQISHAVHSCFLSRKGELLFEAEDIGRHNAVDKVVGMAMREGASLEDCLLFTTGRMPVDMVRKAIRCRIPVMAGKEAPTVESVQLARQYHLTLIGNVKHGSMQVYCR